MFVFITFGINLACLHGILFLLFRCEIDVIGCKAYKVNKNAHEHNSWLVSLPDQSQTICTGNEFGKLWGASYHRPSLPAWWSVFFLFIRRLLCSSLRESWCPLRIRVDLLLRRCHVDCCESHSTFSVTVILTAVEVEVRCGWARVVLNATDWATSCPIRLVIHINIDGLGLKTAPKIRVYFDRVTTFDGHPVVQLVVDVIVHRQCHSLRGTLSLKAALWLWWREIKARHCSLSSRIILILFSYLKL